MKVDQGINSAVLFIIALSGCNEKCPLKHSCGGVYYVVQGCSAVFVCVQTKTKSATVQMKAIEQYFFVGTVYYAVKDNSNFFIYG